MAIDMIIRGGFVVTGGDVSQTDVAINDGKINAIGNASRLMEADRVINASGMIVIPGGIDTHSHYELPFMGETPPETWEQGTAAAAIGGTTTTIDFAVENVHGRGATEAVRKQLARAEKLSTIDYTTHGVFTDFQDMTRVAAEFKRIVDMGIPSFKEFMIYRKEGWYISDWNLLKIFQNSEKSGGLVGVHAENAEIGEAWQAELVSQGKVEYKYHGVAKPNFVEAEAIQRAISIAEFAKSRMYVAHMSTREGVELVGKARTRGLPVWSETCQHYLTVTNKVYETELGLYSMCSPPLRTSDDIDALWQGLADGRVSVVGSDHVAYTKKQKEKHSERFVDVPNGCPGAECRLPIVYSEGVEKGRMSLPRFVEVVSTNAAKMFGIYPKKGVIAPGSDADVVIIDPNREKVLDHDRLHMGTDWSLYRGIRVKGWPVMTILRGDVIVEDERFLGKGGQGQFVKGEIQTSVIKTV
jgi:dihydropyrimidinase